MDKSKHFLDLSKCTEEEQIKVISLLPEPINEDDYDITHLHLYLIYDDEDGKVWFNNEYGNKIADYVYCSDCKKRWKVLKSSPKFIIEFDKKVQFDRENKM